MVKVLTVLGLLVAGCGGPVIDEPVEVQAEAAPPTGHTSNGRCVVTRANSTSPAYETGKCIALDQCIQTALSPTCVQGRLGVYSGYKICLNGVAGAYDTVVCTF